MGLARAGGLGIDLEAELTASPAAYSKFVAGEMAVQEGRFPEARRLLAQATAIDPAFALAHARLGIADEWEGDLDGAARAYESALAHADRLPERWERYLRIALRSLAGDNEKAFWDLSSLIDEGNAMPEAYNTLGEFFTHDDTLEALLASI